MVGTKVAIFTAKELKTYKDTLKSNQKKFLGLITKVGGIASVITEDSHGNFREKQWL